jgi:hypothetical protein
MTFMEKIAVYSENYAKYSQTSVHERLGSWTNFPNTKRLGWRTVSRVPNTQAVNIVER